MEFDDDTLLAPEGSAGTEPTKRVASVIAWDIEHHHLEIVAMAPDRPDRVLFERQFDQGLEGPPQWLGEKRGVLFVAEGVAHVLGLDGELQRLDGNWQPKVVPPLRGAATAGSGRPFFVGMWDPPALEVYEFDLGASGMKRLARLESPLGSGASKLNWAGLAVDEGADRIAQAVGVLSASTKRHTGEAWVALLMSPEGKAVLERHGFIVD